MKKVLLGLSISMFACCFSGCNVSIKTGHFSTDSWETISKAASKGLDYLINAYKDDIHVDGQEDSFVIYDLKNKDEVEKKTRTVKIKDYGEFKVRVVGENNDYLDKERIKKVPLTFQFVNPICMMPYSGYYIPITDWNISMVRNFLNDHLINYFPADLKRNIKKVTKYFSVDLGKQVLTTKDNLFILSSTEIGTVLKYEHCQVYKFYSVKSRNRTDRIIYDQNNNSVYYYLRSQGNESLDYISLVDKDDGSVIPTTTADFIGHVVPCFAI